jgi:hypothetical protein
MFVDINDPAFTMMKEVLMSVEAIGRNSGGQGIYNIVPSAGKTGSSFQDCVQQCGNTSAQTQQAPSLLSGRLPSLFGFEPETPGIITGEEIYEHACEYLEQFNEKIHSIFREHGIDTSIGIDLGTAYGTGDIVVKSHHPDKDKIEAIFRENPELGNEYRKITSMLEIVETARDASAFQAAYSRNPKLAVMQYAYLFDTHLEATMHIEDGRSEVTFERKRNI